MKAYLQDRLEDKLAENSATILYGQSTQKLSSCGAKSPHTPTSTVTAQGKVSCLDIHFVAVLFLLPQNGHSVSGKTWDYAGKIVVTSGAEIVFCKALGKGFAVGLELPLERDKKERLVRG